MTAAEGRIRCLGRDRADRAEAALLESGTFASVRRTDGITVEFRTEFGSSGQAMRVLNEVSWARKMSEPSSAWIWTEGERPPEEAEGHTAVGRAFAEAACLNTLEEEMKRKAVDSIFGKRRAMDE